MNGPRAYSLIARLATDSQVVGSTFGERVVVSLSVFVHMKAKPGKEQEVEDFLKSGLAIVEQEPGTIAWFAIKTGPGIYGIFDVFESEAGREAHLTGRVAEALFAKAPDLFREPPTVGKPDLLAAKLPE